VIEKEGSTQNKPKESMQVERITGMWFLLLLPLLLLLNGCQAAQSTFANTAGNAGAAFVAASTTLTYMHKGKITEAYARSSFINYQSELDGLDQSLPSQNGSPDRLTMQHLLTLYHAAMPIINNPCLQMTCDWHSQVATLNQASEAFLKAGGQ
jgi:hypothetical protein